jgi:hypothetical protein
MAIGGGMIFCCWERFFFLHCLYRDEFGAGWRNVNLCDGVGAGCMRDTGRVVV